MMSENKNLYYLGISGLQKAVRLGKLKGAIKCGYVAWAQDPQQLFRRLWTILFEDCCGDTTALRTFFDYRNGYKRWEDVRTLVVALVKAAKCQEAVYVSWLMKNDQEYIDKLLRDKGWNHLADLRLHFLSKDTLFAYDEAKTYTGDKAWLVDLADRGGSFTREGFNIATPYVVSEHFDYVEWEQRQDEFADVELFEDVLPLAALDKHTRIGKLALSVFAKKTSCPFDSEDLGRMGFLFEGCRCRNLTGNRKAMELWLTTDGELARNWSAAMTPTKRDWFISHRVKLNEIRIWALEKTMTQDWRDFIITASQTEV